MREDNKKEWLVTESPRDLFKAAQRDILTIKSILKDEDFLLEDNVETICRNTSESIEKMLKAWLRDYDSQIKISRTHDLVKLCDILTNINKSFENIKECCVSLNNYTTEFRYGSPFAIEEHEMKECLKNLKYIYDFPLIKEARNKINMENNFNKLPDDIGTLFGKYY